MTMYCTEYLPRINAMNILIEIPVSDNLVNLKLATPDILIAELESGETMEIQLAYKLQNLHMKFSHTETTDHGTKVILMKLPTIKQEKLEEKLNLLMNNSIIWSKSDFSLFDNFELNCIKCQKILVKSDEVVKIFDLPSESWAEMMDFWHCHKPTDDVKDNFRIRFNELKPNKNSIIVGSYYFLMNTGDFQVDVKCGCGAELGVHHRNNTLKLFKWNFSINNKLKYHPYYYAFNVLLDNINMNASRFFKLVDEETGKDSLVVWVFNFGLSISTNTTNKIYDNCLKIMYYEDKIGSDGEGDSFDKVEIPHVVLVDLKNELNKTNLRLPATFRKMQQWNVSYLYV